MRIGLVGAGAVGGYFGARLALGGSDITFIARGAHGEAMRRNGLEVLSPAGDFHLPAPQVAAPGEDGPPFDLLIIAVKMYDLAEAARSVANRATGSAAHTKARPSGRPTAETCCRSSRSPASARRD